MIPNARKRPSAAEPMRAGRATKRQFGVMEWPFTIPENLYASIEKRKSSMNLLRRTRSAVINSIITEFAQTVDPAALMLPPPPASDEKLIRFNVELSEDSRETLKRVCHQFRGVSKSVALEVVLAASPEMRRHPDQFTIDAYLEGGAVTG